MRAKVRGNSVVTWWENLIPAWRQILADHLGIYRPLGEQDRPLLYGITEVDASDSYITNLDALVMLPSLQVLDLSDTHLASLDGLHVLTNLRELTVHNALSLDMVEISRLSALEVLDISYPAHSVGGCLSLLDDLPNLRELYCMACDLSTVVPFLGMEKLKILSINLNPIPLAEVRALSELLPQCRIMA